MASPKAKALNETDEGNISDTTPVPGKPAEEVSEPKGKEAETEEKVSEVSEEEAKKKGYSQRVRELVKEREEEKAKVKSLAEKLAELTSSEEPKAYQPTSALQEEPIARPGEELDASELERRLQAREQRILQKADALSTLRAKQSDVVNRINSEANEAIKAHPQLDPDSDSFDRELSETVTEAVEAHVRANPYKSSVKKFVGRLMKPYERAIAKEVGQETENIAKQVSGAALRPTSIKPKEKPANDKTIEELEEELGVIY